MTPTVRPARPDDRPAIARIQRAAIADPAPSVLVDGLVAPETALVAVDAEVAGYVLTVVGDAQAYVPELAVAPRHQGQGIGSQLLGTAVDRLRAMGIEALRLTARADDDRARGFYEARGFEAVGRENDHYTDGTDGVVYERRFD